MRTPLSPELAAKKEAFMRVRLDHPEKSVRWAARRAGIPAQTAAAWNKRLSEIQAQAEIDIDLPTDDPAETFRRLRAAASRGAAEAMKLGKAGEAQRLMLAAAIADDKVTKLRSTEKKANAKGVEAMTDADLKELTIAIGKALEKGLCAQCRKRRAEVNG